MVCVWCLGNKRKKKPRTTVQYLIPETCDTPLSKLLFQYTNFPISCCVGFAYCSIAHHIQTLVLIHHTSPKINIYTIIIRKTESGFIESLVLFYLIYLCSLIYLYINFKFFRLIVYRDRTINRLIPLYTYRQIDRYTKKFVK